MQPQIQHPTA